MERKEFNREIINAVWNEVVSNLKGTQYVRIFLYKDAAIELLKEGETNKELAGAHFFSSSAWNDIDQSNQIEMYSFEQTEEEIYDEESFSRQFDCDIQESVWEAYNTLIQS